MIRLTLLDSKGESSRHGRSNGRDVKHPSPSTRRRDITGIHGPQRESHKSRHGIRIYNADPRARGIHVVEIPKRYGRGYRCGYALEKSSDVYAGDGGYGCCDDGEDAEEETADDVEGATAKGF